MVGRTEGTTEGHQRHVFLLLSAVVIIAALAAALAVLGSGCSSASIESDWSYDDESKVLTYSGPESMPDYSSTENPITYFDAHDAQSVIFKTNINRISDFTFRGSSIHSMDIPSGVTYVGKCAFGDCNDLKTISFPAGLKTIGSYAFVSCVQLKSAELPSSVEYIGSYAFYNCTSLEKVILPEYDTAQPDRTLVIQEMTFYLCSSLGSIVIPMHVTEIGSYAFCDCSSLYSVTFEEKEIKDGGGKTVVYSSKIRTIGDYAFMGCTSLKTIMIPDMLELMGENIFCGTSKLVSIETRGTNGHFRSSDGVLYDLGLSYLYHYPSAKADSTYIIQSSVMDIDPTAFDGAKNLTALAIGQNELYSAENGVLFASEKAYLVRYPEGKTDSSYTIPEDVRFVMKNAFTGVTGLKNLVLSTTNIKFEEGSLYMGSFGNDVELHVDAPGDYRIPEKACNSFTVLKYGSEGSNSTLIIIIAVCAAVLLIAIIAVIVILRKRRI